MIMPFSFNDIMGDTALGQQCVGRDGLALDGDGFKQGDDDFDFVGAFEFFTALYGKGSDFFWV